jgi:ketosteroid isomerase-like protein
LELASRSTAAALTKPLACLFLLFATAVFAQNGPRSVDSVALERFEQAVALAQRDPAAAIEIFQGLTRDFPNWPEPYNNLAVLYAEQGEEKKAEKALLTAMGTHPTYALVHRNLEALYAGMAGRAYRKALKNDTAAPPPPKLTLASRAAAEVVMVNRDAAAADGGTEGSESIPQPAAKVERANAAPPEPEAGGSETADRARRAVLYTVASWREAWSSQDVERYLSFYGHHFDPGNGVSREHWAAIRRRRVAGPEFIQVDIQNPSVSFQADDRASVRFLQTYRSNTFDSQTIKTLSLSRGSEGWKIIREETGG